jgi:hypothetical protein
MEKEQMTPCLLAETRAYRNEMRIGQERMRADQEQLKLQLRLGSKRAFKKTVR